jgi:hypothetical protein
MGHRAVSSNANCPALTSIDCKDSHSRGSMAIAHQESAGPSSLLVMAVTDKVACLAALLIWILDSYSALCMRNGEGGTFTDFPLLSSVNPVGSPDSTAVVLVPKYVPGALETRRGSTYRRSSNISRGL